MQIGLSSVVRSVRFGLFWMALLLTGCLAQVTCPPPLPSVAPVETHPATTQTVATTKTAKVAPEVETFTLVQMQEDFEAPSQYRWMYPNLWTKIEKDKIDVYPYDWLADYVYGSDGSLWVVGGFGVIRVNPDGSRVHYSIRNGLPNNFFTRVAIAPDGGVWIGGINSTLFRFDGEKWVDEGIKLPPPLDDRAGWLCYSRDISGIDFGPDGSAWVMNSGIEIYRQVYGQWINVPFPKNVLPWAGGGACPKGIRVKADNDITIMLGPCCMSDPSAYHFDGQSWERNKEYAEVEDLLNARHPLGWPLSDAESKQLLADRPYEDNFLLPESLAYSYSKVLITVDKNGLIWLNDGGDIYNNNTNGRFLRLESVLDLGIEIKNPQGNLVLGFGTRVVYYDNGEVSYSLERVVEETLNYFEGVPLTVDQDGKVWLYHTKDGLIAIDHGVRRFLGHIPNNLSARYAGGVLPLRDGRIWVGSAGEIWEFSNERWRQLIIPGTDQRFTHFAEDQNGAIYAATDTSVYQIIGRQYREAVFLSQSHQPMIIPEDGKIGQCPYHKRYAVIGNCPGSFFGPIDYNYNYEARFLGVQGDGSVVYVNNHLVARLQDNKWKSFFFDTFTIDSATVDRDGYIWIFPNSEGLFRLAPDIFDSYLDITP